MLLILFGVPGIGASGDLSLKGFIDSYAYGYHVKVAINGTPLKLISGKGQQATRLFGIDHPLKAQVPRDQTDIFVLKEGENTIAIEFEKQEEAPSALQIKLEVPDRCTVPLFQLVSKTLRKRKNRKEVFHRKKEMPPQLKPLRWAMKNQTPLYPFHRSGNHQFAGHPFRPPRATGRAGQKEFRQFYPRPGWVEHDPLEIWSRPGVRGVGTLAEKGVRAEDIFAVGITNQRGTTLVWDRFDGDTPLQCHRLAGPGVRHPCAMR